MRPECRIVRANMESLNEDVALFPYPQQLLRRRCTGMILRYA
jgi:hypothetical protein